MAKQVINRGTVAGDGTGEILFDAFGKAINNFDELYAYLNGGEFTPGGDLVFPSFASLAFTYLADGRVDKIDVASYDSKAWTLTMNYTGDLLTSQSSTDGTTNWQRSFTYNPDDTIDTVGDWAVL